MSAPRLYTDEEVARILREVSASADLPAGFGASASGVSLEQLKAAAAEVDLDPSLVERVALRLAERGPESFLERLAGGPVHLRDTIRLATRMSATTSAHLLSAVRAAAEVPGDGRADGAGFFWHGWCRANRVSVTAHGDEQGTRVQVLLDRKAPMVNTVLASLTVIVMFTALRVAEVDSYADLLVLAAVPIGVLVAARMYWQSSTRSLRAWSAALRSAVHSALPASGDGGNVPETQD